VTMLISEIMNVTVSESHFRYLKQYWYQKYIFRYQKW